eukprot:2760249-Amphidinium_carterae.1
MAGGKTSDGVTGKSILDVKIEAVDQRTALAIGSADEVDRQELISGANHRHTLTALLQGFEGLDGFGRTVPTITIT